ncbi:multimodular transpeptidase-transglycosylase PbpC [soil metagenome]
MNDWSLEPYRFPDSEPPKRPAAPEPVTFRADLAEPVRKTKVRRRRTFAVVLSVLTLTLIGGGVWVWAYLFADLPKIPADSVLWTTTSAPGMTFADRTGKIIATRGAKHGYRVRVSEIPRHVTLAFLAAEDRRFYRHGAVDIKGMSRALWTNITHGHVVQGGSTLTQQIAKTLFLKPDRTIKRKVQEAVIAYQLEGRMTKNEVFELYLNRIFFGAGAYGLDAAAETYFGKSARNLTLAEASLLAGLPKAPSRLALTSNFNAALQRSHLVLDSMREEGWINEAEESLALASPPQLAPEPPGEGDFGYLLDMASAEAVKTVGPNAPDLMIRLSIDSKLQTNAQTVLRQVIAADGKRAGASQGAMVAMTPDGAIRALVGGVDHRESPFNRATQAKRQPGSSFKPFVYAAALEKGIKPTDIRVDAPVRFGSWTPANYGGGYRGPVTVDEALVRSINTVAVRLGSEVGRHPLGEIAHRFGLTSIPNDPDLSVSLGAYEVSLLELTAGYQVFQNAGGRLKPFLIEQIANSRGEVLYQHPTSTMLQVYDSARAGTMVRMMEGVITRGTGTRASFGRPAAGKTGTSQNWRDAWFVGFTPDFIAGVWVGNDDDKPMSHVAGGTLPAEIWRRFMIVAHNGLAVRNFDWLPPPELVPEEEVIPEEPKALPDPRNGFYETLASEFGAASAADRDSQRFPETDPR